MVYTMERGYLQALANPSTLAVAFFSGLLGYTIFYGVYNVYFHPLRHFPGPKLWATSFLFRHAAAIRGDLDVYIKRLHDIYGDVVRFSPDELSFITEHAWKDIYGHREQPLIKDPSFYGPIRQGKTGTPSIFNADKFEHPRLRKALAHAFSEKALRDQEPFVKRYVELLVEKLRGAAQADLAVDLVEWYNFTTFDVIGELAIGKSFNCLADSKYHSWVAGIWKAIKMGPYIRAVATYTDITRLFRVLAPKTLKEARLEHERYVRENSQERASKGILLDRPDFLSYILKNKGTKEELSPKEIEGNTGFLLLAGSETTATALSGTTFYLLKTPETLKKLTREVRTAFDSEADINFMNCADRLPYMHACLTEGLRVYPPGPVVAPRRTAEGVMTNIDGYAVPGYTSVGVHAWTASHSPKNFHLPTSFIPERWLPPATTDPSSPFYNDRRGASQPFSYGPRNCLGKSMAYSEMKVILAQLLWNFDIELQPESENWVDQKVFIMWEKGRLMCKLREFRA